MKISYMRCKKRVWYRYLQILSNCCRQVPLIL